MSTALTIFAECRNKKCGAKFAVGDGSSTTSFRQKYVDKNGRSILLTYYDCPKCGLRHFVQADDAYSLELLANVTKAFVRVAAARQNGRKVTPVQKSRYEKGKGHLDRYRNKLMHEWTGRFVTEAMSGREYTLEFSV